MAKVFLVKLPSYESQHWFSSAAENAKSWVTHRTTHGWWLGGPYQFWVVRQSTETMKSIEND